MLQAYSQVIVCGTMEFDLEDFRLAVNMSIPATSAEWFWQIVEEMSPEERAMLLVFITGSSAVPVGGFKSLSRAISIVPSSRAQDSLPITHTCFNIMEIPSYSRREVMKQKLLFAVHNCGATDYGMA